VIAEKNRRALRHAAADAGGHDSSKVALIATIMLGDKAVPTLARDTVFRGGDDRLQWPGRKSACWSAA